MTMTEQGTDREAQQSSVRNCFITTPPLFCRLVLFGFDLGPQAI